MMSLAYAALWAFVFTMPWENIIVISGVGTIGRLLGMLALGLALLAAVVSGRLRRWHALHVAAMLFLIWGACGLLVFQKEARIPNKFETYIQLVLVLWMIWELAPSRQRVLGLLTAYVFGASVAALSTIMVFRSASGGRRFAAEGFDPNDLAMNLALALPMAWYLGMTYRRPVLQWLCRGYLLVGLIALGLTGSRGGMLAAMIGLLIVPLTMTRLSPARLATAIVLLGITGTVAVAYIPETAMQRLSTTTTAVEGGDLGGRTRIWKAGVEAFLNRPIMGSGTGSFRNAVMLILGYPRVSHNSYLTVLVEQGIVGFILYAGMFAAVFFAILNLPPMDRRFALVLFATLGIAMLPLAWEDSKPAWFILAALLGLAKARVARPVMPPIRTRVPGQAVPTRVRGPTRKA